MEKYNYLEEVKSNVLDYIKWECIMVTTGNRVDVEERLNTDLWLEDSVTGNGSGSYWCNSWRAGEALLGNWDLLEDALNVFGSDVNPIQKGEEWCDVTIRCYLLGQAISEVLDEIEKEEE